jgi:hypothetical protein
MSDPVSMNTAKFEEKDSFFQGFNEALLSMEAGILRYGENSNLLYASEKAYEFFPDLNHPQKGLGNIKLFFAFVYDHSLEWQDQAALTTQWAPLGGFQEIVRLESGRTLLARILRQSEKETTVIFIRHFSGLSADAGPFAGERAKQNSLGCGRGLRRTESLLPMRSQMISPFCLSTRQFPFSLGGGGRPLVGSSLREELMERFSNQREEIRTKLDLRTGMTLWKFINSPKGDLAGLSFRFFLCYAERR